MEYLAIERKLASSEVQPLDGLKMEKDPGGSHATSVSNAKNLSLLVRRKGKEIKEGQHPDLKRNSNQQQQAALQGTVLQCTEDDLAH